jgi:hypothetical protein
MERSSLGAGLAGGRRVLLRDQRFLAIKPGAAKV